jgi:hypothetical protein
MGKKDRDRDVSRNLARLTRVYVWRRLQEIDERLERATPWKAEALFEQLRWWEEQLLTCQKRGGYPVSLSGGNFGQKKRTHSLETA